MAGGYHYSPRDRLGQRCPGIIRTIEALSERDLHPAKCQQNVSGRLTSEDRTRDRYTIRGYVSTAVNHGHNALAVLRDAILDRPWMMPALPAPT